MIHLSPAHFPANALQYLQLTQPIQQIHTVYAIWWSAYTTQAPLLCSGHITFTQAHHAQLLAIDTSWCSRTRKMT